MSFRGGDFSTGTTGNFQPELTKDSFRRCPSTGEWLKLEPDGSYSGNRMPFDRHRRVFPLFSCLDCSLVQGLAAALANNSVGYVPVNVELDDQDHRAMTHVRIFGGDLVHRSRPNDLG